MADIRSREKIERYISVEAGTLDRFEREGRRLGEKEIPASDATDLSRNEIDEINSASQLWNTFQNEVTSAKQKAEAEVKAVTQQISVVLPSKEVDAEETCDAELGKIETEIGPGSAAFSSNQEQLDQVTADLKAVKSSLNNRELQSQFETVYLPFMFALAFAEVWVNSKSFELFFASNQLISLLLASAVGAMLVFFAHITGASIKRALPEEAKRGRAKTTVSMVMLNSLVAVFILFLGKMRQAWVALDMEEDAPIDIVFGDNALGGLEDIIGETSGIESLIGTELGNEGLFLLLFNVLVYVAGTVAAMLRHDSHPDYESLVKKEQKHRDRQVTMKKRYQSSVAAVEKKKADTLAQVRKETVKKDGELDGLKNLIDSLNSDLSNSKKALNKTLQNKIKAFRRGNRSSRKTKAPSYFSSLPTLE